MASQCAVSLPISWIERKGHDLVTVITLTCYWHIGERPLRSASTVFGADIDQNTRVRISRHDARSQINEFARTFHRPHLPNYVLAIGNISQIATHWKHSTTSAKALHKQKFHLNAREVEVIHKPRFLSRSLPFEEELSALAAAAEQYLDSRTLQA